MRARLFRLVSIAALAGALWVVPSVGTQGQGTLGDRFVHPDRPLLAADASAKRDLRTADDVAARAVAKL